MRQWRSELSFYSTCTIPKAPSVVRAVPLSIPISLFDQKRMHLTRSTKDRKKGCAYDPGALNKQGALKNQTLRYFSSSMQDVMVI